MVRIPSLVALSALALAPVYAIDLVTNDFASVRSTASKIAKNLVDHYHGNEPGNVPGTLEFAYYWWNGGMLFDVLVQYYNLTGDSQYNEIVAQALQFQVGRNEDYHPANYTNQIGNDDQSTWALAALSAAESKFPAGNVSYAKLAENVFNAQVTRWDESSCNGGLRWQIYSFNNGYNYKNTFSNGNFVQLAARLASNTGNTTYTDWASKAFKWTLDIGFIDAKWNVYEGALVTEDCKAISKLQFSAIAGTYLVGAANLYNVTGGASEWKTALDGLLTRTLEVFFPNGIATEVACESVGRCNNDQENFKGLLIHQLVDTIRAAPYTADKIRPLLISSATGAAKACNADGGDCGLNWNGTSTGSSNLGEQLSALSAVQALLLWDQTTSVPANTTATAPSQSGSSSSPISSSSSKPSATSGSPAAGFGSAMLLMAAAVVMGLLVVDI